MNYIITKNREFFDKIGKYNFSNLEKLAYLPETIAVDTETTGLSPLDSDMFSVQIGTGKDNFLIDLQDNSGITFEDIIPFLINKKMIFHNATFDLKFFYKHNFFPKFVHDTMLSSRILYNGEKTIRHNFRETMLRELGIIYDKSSQKNIHITKLSTDKAIQYAFNDVDKLIELTIVLYKQHVKNGSVEALKLHNNFTKALAYTEMCGLPIDIKCWENKVNKDMQLFNEKKKKVEEYIWDNLPEYRDSQTNIFDIGNEKRITILLSSSKQMIPVFNKLGINTKDKDGKDSINKTVLAKTDHEFVKMWLELQDIYHDITTFGKNILDKSINGRLYTSFNPILNTARISTRKKEINFLNFPANKKTRSCFKAKKGFKIIVCDYSGQENAVGADLHGDEVMVKSVVEDADLHCAFARVLYPEIKNKTDEEIKTKYSKYRTAAKSPRFLFSYGGNAFTLHQNNNIPLKKAEEIEKSYKKLHKGIYEWGNKVLETAIEKGYIESAGGFKLKLPYYKEFIKIHNKLKDKDSTFWKQYKLGKIEYTREKESEKVGDYYNVGDWNSYTLFNEYKRIVSKYFKIKNEYLKLCLNNPIQTTSAFQTKSAWIKLFEIIVENNDIWDVKIVNVVHDEIVLEVKEELAEKYKNILEDTMIYEANKWLKSGIIEMKADAAVGDDWYNAKKG